MAHSSYRYSSIKTLQIVGFMRLVKTHDTDSSSSADPNRTIIAGYICSVAHPTLVEPEWGYLTIIPLHNYLLSNLEGLNTSSQSLV